MTAINLSPKSPKDDTVLRIGIVAGEASGDVLAAGFVAVLKDMYPNAIFEGIGGKHLTALGLNSLFDMEELSVMGLVEVLKHLPRLLHIRKAVVQHFLDNPPDIFIGVDAPDFNLAVEAKLKQAGVKTVHYVSPTVWAWRESRIHKIAKATNLVLGIFPFEADIYNKYKVPYQYVGHTMADSIPLVPDQQEKRQLFALDGEDKVLALLPGSRAREVDTLLPDFIKTAELLTLSLPALKVIIPAANNAREVQIKQLLKALNPKVEVVVTQLSARDVMIAANAVLLASGTATLEAMLCKKPMVVGYKMSKMTHMIMKRLYKPDYFSLPNILANEALVPELLQEDVNPQNMADKLRPMLENEPHALISRFTQLHKSLQLNADEQAAKAIQGLLVNRT
ncbi:lipid-A-disaccharide synthase [Brumicola nitratireducens]|uniref:Lipid-A-disaccharide synthase n=1 Tax=Glaciecola nitratireducens (strain JCM 12485 / KCTC 12276 / FR1064) TaxID=1085623 RepID=G4QI09_GLANF|nr:lipid-A-disaccharide synthase [Glaciecola nitratireducens]AEP30542.1 tetraacyldisaccharide-1-P synthase [Glaciecola nitratireducens FR1064]